MQRQQIEAERLASIQGVILTEANNSSRAAMPHPPLLCDIPISTCSDREAGYVEELQLLAQGALDYNSP